MNFPRHAADFHFNIVGAKRGAEVGAIFLDSIGRLIFAAEKRNDGLRHFSTRKLPSRRASMPELKKVRMASVGV